MADNREFGGYIKQICFGGKVYKIKAEVIEVRPITCAKCGATFTLTHGEGKCPYCRTNYSTHIVMEEV